MAYASNFAAGCFVTLLMIILAALTSEARPNVLVQESATAEIKHHVFSPGISTASQDAAVIHHETASKLIALGTCQGKSITIDNHAVATSPGHAPAFQVQIINLCDCPVSHLILNCPNFASAELVDPNKLKTQGDGTCLVKNGNAMAHGEVIIFQYHQSFKLPLSFRSASFGC